MLENGKYAAWFKTANGQGTGIVVLTNGEIAGQDSVIAYSGFYEQDGDQFTATVRTRRYCEGQPSLFGTDEVELKLLGKSTGLMVVCSGTTEQAPGLVFQATLIRVQEAPSVLNAERPPIPPFDPLKMPRIRAGR
jgi:hypothetical protein